MKQITTTLILAFITLLSMLSLQGCGGSDGVSTDSWGASESSGTAWQVDNLDDPGQPLRPGDWIKIESSRFGSEMNGSSVTFTLQDGTTGQADLYEQWTDTAIVCRVPLDLFSKTKTPITVPSDDISDPGDTITTLRGQAEVTIRETEEHFLIGEGMELVIKKERNPNPSDSSPLPVVTSITSAQQGQGTMVTMTGSKFTDLDSVVIIGLSAWIIRRLGFIDDRTVIFAVPPDVPVGTYTVVVENRYGKIRAPGKLNVVSATTMLQYPLVEGITSAVEGQGSTVTMTGQYFTDLRSVSILTTPPTTARNLAVTSDTTATFSVPGTVHAGTYSVLATNTTGPCMRFGRLTVFSASLPVVERITPAAESQATTVTMTGSKFTGLTAVSILTTPPTEAGHLTVTSDTTATFSVPGTIHAGTYSVSVTNPSGTTTGTDKLIVTPGAIPLVASITLAVEGQATTVTLTGHNLSRVTAVSILTATPTEATNLTTLDDLTLTFTVPASVPAGIYSVRVTNFSGTGTGENKLIVTAASGGGGGGGGGVIWAPTIGAYQYGTKGMTLKERAPVESRGDITVTNLDDDGGGSLRNAIATAVEGDTVKFSVGGEITLTTGELVITGKSLIIDGSSAPSAVTVKTDGAFRVFMINSGSDKTATIKSLTIKGGDGSAAGGNFNGGSISVDASSALNLTDCTIDGSKALYGGGIYTAGTAALTRCTISNNSAVRGGGIYLAVDGAARLSNCTISGNNADQPGGGVAIDTKGAATITNSTISGNTAATDYGGGIACLEGAAYLLNTMVIGNTAPAGGDLYNGETIMCAYYCWYNAISGTVTTQPTAPNITSAYVPGMLGGLILNPPGTTNTMEVKGNCPAINKGAYVYYNDDDGFYLQGSDGKYNTLEAFTTPTKASPSTDRINTDQRGAVRQQ